MEPATLVLDVTRSAGVDMRSSGVPRRATQTIDVGQPSLQGQSARTPSPSQSCRSSLAGIGPTAGIALSHCRISDSSGFTAKPH
jgi:hypothetical protein